MDDLEDQVPDSTLIERVRAGDREATVELWTRHYPAVLLAARRVTRQPRDAEEIASDAFSSMLSALSNGTGPTTSVRAYLMTSVRNLAANRATRLSAGDVLTDDIAVFDKATPDTTARMTELQLVRVAFAELPQRWQVVLWRTAVDKDSNIVVAEAMGLSPNGVAALAKRARRGFRLAYLRTHLSDIGVDPQCRPFIAGLADLSVSEEQASPAVVEHVASCAACTARLEELRAVDGNLAGVLGGPVIFGLVPSKLLVAAAGTAGSSVVTIKAPTTGFLRLRWSQWGLGAGGVACAVVAVLLTSRPDVVVVPTTTAPTTTAQAPTLTRPSAAPAPTTATLPVLTTSPQPSRPSQSSTRQPTPRPTVSTSTPSSTPLPTPPPVTSSTSSDPRTTPLDVELSIGGTTADTTLDVRSSAQGVRGSVRLTIQLPQGVTLTAYSGDWNACDQNGAAVTCTAGASPQGRWAGTVHTQWAAGASGAVRATVAGRYVNGSPAVGSVGTTWPP